MEKFDLKLLSDKVVTPCEGVISKPQVSSTFARLL